MCRRADELAIEAVEVWATSEESQDVVESPQHLHISPDGVVVPHSRGTQDSAYRTNPGSVGVRLSVRIQTF